MPGVLKVASESFNELSSSLISRCSFPQFAHPGHDIAADIIEPAECRCSEGILSVSEVALPHGAADVICPCIILKVFNIISLYPCKARL